MNMAFRASIMICFWKTNASVSDIYPYRRKPSLEQAISLMHAYTHSVHTEHNKRMHYRFPQKHLATLLSMSAFPPFRCNGNHRKETERKHAEKVIWKKNMRFTFVSPRFSKPSTKVSFFGFMSRL